VEWDFCTSSDLYNMLAWLLILFHQFTEIASYEGVTSKEYDLDSIMHYNSFIFAKDGKACYDGDKSKCPITYYTDLTKPETKWKPGDIINYAHKVSKGDADFVKTVYKWGES
jgi:hypothetical protein